MSFLAIVVLFTLSKGCNYVGPAIYYKDHDGDRNDGGGGGEYWYKDGNRSYYGCPPRYEQHGNQSHMYYDDCGGDYHYSPDYDHIGEPTPVNFCVSEVEGGNASSMVFLCAPWGLPYAFMYDTENCVGEPSVSHIEGDFECGSTEPCNVWHGRKSDIKDGETCEESATNYGEKVGLADVCNAVLERRDGDVRVDSFYATCDDSTGAFSYAYYPGVSDCSGEPNVTLTEGCHDGIFDDDGTSFLSLIQCGQVSPNKPTGTCSFVRNASWIEHEEYYSGGGGGEYWYKADNKSYFGCPPGADCGGDGGDYYSHSRRETNEDIAPLGDDLCVNKFKNGSFSTQLWFCSDVLQRAMIAKWYDRPVPGQCNTPPDDVQMIDESEDGYFACNEAAGPCPFAWIRVSKFEDTEGDGECKFGDNYEEMVIATEECFLDGAARASCISTDFTYEPFADYDTCVNDGTPLDTISLSSGMCYILDGDEFGTLQTAGSPGEYSYFQALQCGDEVFNPDPDCRYVENPMWLEPDEYYRAKEYDDYDDYDMKNEAEGFKEPIGVCVSRQKGPDEVHSFMYICPPFGGNTKQVVVAVWDAIDCGEGTGELLYITEVMNTGFSCSGYCDKILLIEMNNVFEGDECVKNDTHWGQKAFLTDTCTDSIDYNDDGTVSFGSTELSCDASTGEVVYSKYNEPGCAGTPGSMTVDTQSNTPCSPPTGDGAMYMEMLLCGANPNVPPNECSYVVNPQYNATESDGHRDKEGAIPLTSEICNRDYEEGGSRQYFCDYQSGLAFIALWNGSLACSGKPDEVYEVTSSVDDMVCASDDVSNCAYSQISVGAASDDCAPQNGIMRDMAFIINMCWPGEDPGTSWMVDCKGETAWIKTWQTEDCSGTPDKDIEVNDGECTTELGDSGDNTYFRLDYCSVPAIPTAEPTTQEPSVSPVTTQPSASPVTVEPSVSPVTVEPSASPVTVEPSASPITTTLDTTCSEDASEELCISPGNSDKCKKTPAAVAKHAAGGLANDVCTICAMNTDVGDGVCECFFGELQEAVPRISAWIATQLLTTCFDDCGSIDDVTVEGTECSCESLQCGDETGVDPVDISGESIAYRYGIVVAVWIGFMFYMMQ